MRLLITRWLTVASALLYQESVALKIQESCVGKSDLQKTAKLNCGGHGQIVRVDVSLGNGTCNTPSGQQCLGQTPSFLVDHFSCYWKSNCVINWPHESIVTPGEGCSLVGSYPDFMRISYKCFESNEHYSDSNAKKTVILDICDGGSNSYTTERGAEAEMSGIIRSHKEYPWDYPETIRQCTLKIFFPVVSNNEVQKLAVSIQDFDRSESDNLTITTVRKEGKETKVTGITTVTNDSKRNMVFGDASTLYVNFTFIVGEETNSGKGFVLCFKFANRSENLNNYEVCSGISRPGDIENVADTNSTLVLSQKGEGLNISTVDSVFTPPAESPESLVTTTALPEKCKRKKNDRAKKRCANRMARKKRNKKKGKNRNKDRRRKRNKGHRKKRHNKEA